MQHIGRSRHQQSAIRNLKKNLSEDDMLRHIDFSENFACKYTEEIQSIHFGANRSQISLHTVMLYRGERKEPLCTISKDLHHDAPAIFAHLLPILQEHSDVKNLHIFSDSPSNQYRNKAMFFIMYTKIIPIFSHLRTFSWNYSESGHGKGAPDGIGGVIKRTCDRAVAAGVQDIASFDQFASFLKDKSQKVRVIPLPKVLHDPELVASLSSAPIVKGSMRVHQVKWTALPSDINKMQFNSLSCFECERRCKHNYFINEVSFGKSADLEPLFVPAALSNIDEPASINIDEPASVERASLPVTTPQPSMSTRTKRPRGRPPKSRGPESISIDGAALSNIDEPASINIDEPASVERASLPVTTPQPSTSTHITRLRGRPPKSGGTGTTEPPRDSPQKSGDTCARDVTNSCIVKRLRGRPRKLILDSK